MRFLTKAGKLRQKLAAKSEKFLLHFQPYGFVIKSNCRDFQPFINISTLTRHIHSVVIKYNFIN